MKTGYTIAVLLLFVAAAVSANYYIKSLWKRPGSAGNPQDKPPKSEDTAEPLPTVPKKEEILERLIACAKTTQFTKARYEEACENPIPFNGPARTDFLNLNKCIWEAAEVLDSTTGRINALNAANLVRPEDAASAIATVDKCDPKDDTLNVDEKALKLFNCYRATNNEKYFADITYMIESYKKNTRDCLALRQIFE